MRQTAIRLTVIVIGALLLVTAPATGLAGPELADRGWTSISAPSGFNGPVRATLSFQGDLVVAGTFQAGGGVAMNHVGRFDGFEWSRIGDGFDQHVLCLAEFNGDLVAGGMFSSSGPDSLAHIARWDGVKWTALGPGLETPVAAMVAFDGTLVAAAYSTCLEADIRHRPATCVKWSLPIFRWDGASWTSLSGPDNLGEMEALGGAHDLVVHEGQLVAAARVRAPDGAIYPALLLTDEGWVPFGPGAPDVPGTKRPYISRFLSDGGRLLAAGYFPGVPNHLDRPSRLIAYEDGEWVSRDPGFNGTVMAMIRDGDRILFAGGFDRITGVEGTLVGSVAAWDGAAWSAFGTAHVPVRALAVQGSTLFAGTRTMVAWTGSEWAPVDAPGNRALAGSVLGLAVYDGDVVARTKHRIRGYGDARAIAAVREGVLEGLDPSWTVGPVSTALPLLDHTYRSDVSAGLAYPIHVFEGRLYACLGRDQVHRWAGERWEALEDFTWQSPYSDDRWLTGATAFATWRGRLVAGGQFDRVGDVDALGIAVYDGETWSPLGGGIPPVWSTGEWECTDWGCMWNRVRALVEYDGDLVAGGVFCEAGDAAALNIARWDGEAWHALGSGLAGQVMVTAIFDGDLYAGGYFTETGSGRQVNYLARWDGAEWRGLDGGLDGPVHALAVYNGRLVAGGLFHEADGNPARHVAAWDGLGWLTMGSGVNGAVNALTTHDGSLYVGGEFTAAGSRTAIHLAQWTEPEGGAELTDLTAERTDDGVVLGWTLGAVGPGFEGITVDREPFRDDAMRITSEPVPGVTGVVFTDPEPSPNRTVYRLSAVTRTGVEREVATVAVGPADGLRLALLQNHPNPFRAGPAGEVTRITFTLPRLSPVRLRVYDLSGRMVATLLDTQLPPGEYGVPWTGLDATGRRVASGMYFYRLESDAGALVRKIMILD